MIHTLAVIWVIYLIYQINKDVTPQAVGLVGLTLSILIFPIRLVFDVLQWIQPRFSKLMGILGIVALSSFGLFVFGCLSVIAFRKLFL